MEARRAPVWSLERSESLRSCILRYFHEFHLAPRGVAEQASLDERRARLFAAARPLGHLVREIGRRALLEDLIAARRGTERPDPDRLLEELRDRWRVARSRWSPDCLDDPPPPRKRHRPILEILYPDERVADVLRQTAHDLPDALKAFRASDVREWLLGLPDSAFVWVAGPDTPLEESHLISVDGVRVLHVPSLVVHLPDGLQVLELSVSEPPNEDREVVLAAWVERFFGGPAGSVSIRTVTFPTGEQRERIPEPRELDAFFARVRTEADEMALWAAQADRSDAISHFPPTEEEARCDECRFRGLCPAASRKSRVAPSKRSAQEAEMTLAGPD